MENKLDQDIIIIS